MILELLSTARQAPNKRAGKRKSDYYPAAHRPTGKEELEELIGFLKQVYNLKSRNRWKKPLEETGKSE